jgi:hypothetical protein
MSATVIGYWPGMTDAQVASQPGFFNDCHAFGNWMAERELHPDVLDALDTLGVGALRSYTTDGLDDADVDWVTPTQLADAVERLRGPLLARDPRVARIVETYAIEAPGFDPAHQELA